MKKENKEFVKQVCNIAIPMGIQSTINDLVLIINNIMIGSLGDFAMSGINVINTYSWLANCLVTAIAGGALIICAQESGRNEYKNIKKMLSFVLFYGIINSLIFFIISALFPEFIISVYSNVSEIMEPAKEYLSILKYSFFLNTFVTAITTILQSIKQVKIGVYTSILACVINGIFNYLFIYGHFGLPQLGVAGTALGTILGKLVQVIILIYFIEKKEPRIAYRFKDFNPKISKELLGTFLKITFPLLFINVANSSTSSMQTIIAGHVDKFYISANSIVHTAWGLTACFSFGIANSASVIIGNTIGSGDIEKAKRQSKKFIIVSVIFGIISALLVYITIPMIARLYTQAQPETINLTLRMIPACSLTVVFNIIGTCLCDGVLQAAGHTKQLMYLNIGSTWLFALPFSYLLGFKLNVDAAYLYFFLRCNNVFRTVYGVYKILKENWITVF